MGKIKIPLKLFGKETGEIEIDVPVSFTTDLEKLEDDARHIGKLVGTFVGAFREELQLSILGYEKCPGIENAFDTLKLCEEDDILRERLLELKRIKYREANTTDENIIQTELET